MDKKGFMIGMLVNGLRIFSKQKYQNSGLKQRLQDGNREWITLLLVSALTGLLFLQVNFTRPSAVTYRIPGF
jgi:hypothetical protein